eukprot:scaffold195110_cov18-Prasinocladus_malaysianus.AAC.2
MDRRLRCALNAPCMNQIRGNSSSLCWKLGPSIPGDTGVPSRTQLSSQLPPELVHLVGASPNIALDPASRPLAVGSLDE